MYMIEFNIIQIMESKTPNSRNDAQTKSAKFKGTKNTLTLERFAMFVLSWTALSVSHRCSTLTTTSWWCCKKVTVRSVGNHPITSIKWSCRYFETSYSTV